MKKNRFLTIDKFFSKTGLEAPFIKLYGLMSTKPYR